MRHPFVFCVVFMIGGLLTKLTNELEREHMQTCTNCDKGLQCQNQPSETNTTELQQCGEECNSSSICDVGVYTSAQKLCQLYNCHLVQESCGKMTIRKSISDDCLVYELGTYPGYGGASCSALMRVDDISHLEYCLDLCLDTKYCRGLSYYQTTGNCVLLQSCNGFIPYGEGWTFVNRTCIGSNSSLIETDCQILTTDYTTNELPSPSFSDSVTSLAATITAPSNPTMQYIPTTPTAYATTPSTTMLTSTSGPLSTSASQDITATSKTLSSTVVSTISGILRTQVIQYKTSATITSSITPSAFMASSVSGVFSTSPTQYALATSTVSSANFFTDAGRVIALFTSAGLVTLAAAGVCIYCVKAKWSGSVCRNPSSPDGCL